MYHIIEKIHEPFCIFFVSKMSFRKVEYSSMAWERWRLLKPFNIWNRRWTGHQDDMLDVEEFIKMACFLQYIS